MAAPYVEVARLSRLAPPGLRAAAEAGSEGRGRGEPPGPRLLGEGEAIACAKPPERSLLAVDDSCALLPAATATG